MSLRKNPRYQYSAITERADYCWPDAKRLAVYVALNVEQYQFGEGMIEELVPAGAQPDVLNYSWCDYGTRVGVWRILDALEEFHIPATVLVNSDLYATCPAVIEAFRKRGDEIACHGRTNSERQGGMTEIEERALIDEATRIIGQYEGQAPQVGSAPGFPRPARLPICSRRPDMLTSWTGAPTISRSGCVPQAAR